MNACEICGTTEGVLCNWKDTGWRCSQHSTDVPTSNQTMLWPLDAKPLDAKPLDAKRWKSWTPLDAKRDE